MDEIQRLKKRVEKLAELKLKHRAEILRLRKLCREYETEIERLEAEVKSLVEAIEPGSWK